MSTCKNGHISERTDKQNRCVQCVKEKKAREYIRNREKIIQRSKLNYEKNKESILLRQKISYAENKQAISEREKQKRINRSPEKIEADKERDKIRWAKNKDKYSASSKAWYEKNKEYVKQKEKEYAALDHVKKRIRERSFKKYHSSPEIRMAYAMRKMLRKVVNGSEGARTSEQLGYTSKELLAHLIGRFSGEMTLANYGTYWEIDHIIPIAEMLRLGVTCPKKINALSNLQPLTFSENRSKRDSFQLSMS